MVCFNNLLLLQECVADGHRRAAKSALASSPLSIWASIFVPFLFGVHIDASPECKYR